MTACSNRLHRADLFRRLGLVVLLAACAGRAAAGGIPQNARAILVTGSPWRQFVTWRKPVVPAEAMKAAGKSAAGPAVLPVKIAWSSAPGIQHLETAPPPKGWRTPEFNDADWPRSLGPVRPRSLSAALLCLRGRFTVTSPRAVRNLYLSMSYRGGAVVYLNGTEVARTDVPRGTATADTPAKPYPAEAFVSKSGKALPTERYTKGDDRQRVSRRNRSFGPVKLSTRALRKGVNVLAVQLHRSDFHPVALTWWSSRGFMYGRPVHWTPVGLLGLRLAAVGRGIVPNITRPKGTQVWTADLHDRLARVSFGDPRGRGGAIRVVGARNGFHSGAFVLSSTAPLKDVRCSVGRLTREGGKESIPASAVQVRYVLKGDVSRSRQYRRQLVLDTLTAAPPKIVTPAKGRYDPRARVRAGLSAAPVPGAVQLIWVTVHVPKEAVAGKYVGSVRVSARGVRRPFRLPLRLEVADWAVPDPKNFRTHVGVYQSPTTLAIHYKVPEWSRRHWQLMEKSFKLLAQVGNKLVNIPIVNRTQFGNDEGMVYWIRKPGGGYDYDFKVFDRYMGLVKKYLGPQKFVALQVWHSGGWRSRPADQQNTVTVVDERTGKRERMQVPTFGTSESRKFWRPVLSAIKKRLTKDGMGKAMCLGILSDGTAPPQVFKMFDEIMPGVGWTRGCHSVTRAKAPYPLRGGGKVVYHEFCYGLGIPVPSKRIPRIWNQKGPGTAYFRSDFDNQILLRFHLFAERGLYCGTRGIGRVCLDFWCVPRTIKSRTQLANIYNRWPHSSCAQRAPTVYSLSQPGPDGALATLRLELLREGIQTAEAAIVVSEAMDKHAAKLGRELTAKCRAVLVERINVCRQVNGVGYGLHNGWQDRDARLFGTAAEVSKKLRRKGVRK